MQTSPGWHETALPAKLAYNIFEGREPQGSVTRPVRANRREATEAEADRTGRIPVMQQKGSMCQFSYWIAMAKP